jgi:hypothetical protein
MKKQSKILNVNPVEKNIKYSELSKDGKEDVKNYIKNNFLKDFDIFKFSKEISLCLKFKSGAHVTVIMSRKDLKNILEEKKQEEKEEKKEQSKEVFHV